MKNDNCRQSAEQSFREAFSRLRSDRPKILPKGTPVSQNNVAKEAGRDTSALRKSRYPILIEEIQLWVTQHQNRHEPKSRELLRHKERKSRTLIERMKILKAERDFLVSLLNEANAKILDLTMENRRLRPIDHESKVSQFSRRNDLAESP